MAESLAAVKIGVLDDTPSPGVNRETFERVARLTFGDVSRRFARPVEFIFERVDGLPWGSAKAVEDGYRALVEAGTPMRWAICSAESSSKNRSKSVER